MVKTVTLYMFKSTDFWQSGYYALRVPFKTTALLRQTAYAPKADHSLKSFLGDGPELSTPWTAEALTQSYFPEEVALSEAVKVKIQEKKGMWQYEKERKLTKHNKTSIAYL